MRIDKNTTYYLEAFVTDAHGEPVAGLTVSYKVIKCSDNSELANGSLTDLGNGIYQGSYLFTTIGQYRVIYNAPYDYTDMIESILVVDPSAVESDVLNRILGLSQHNYRIFQQRYDQNQNLTFARIRLYPTATDVDADTNHFAEYEVYAVYGKNNLVNNVIDYRVKKIL